MFVEENANEFVHIIGKGNTNGAMTLKLEGGYYEKGEGDEEPTWTEMSPGTTHLYFTTSSGEVFRTVTVIVLKPATDMTISVVSGNSSQTLDLNNLSNSATVMAIANRKYQFSPALEPADSTDEVEWAVYEGNYEGEEGQEAAATDKAEITDNGLFTPKTNGIVTIVAKCKPTYTTDRAANYGPKNYQGYDEDGNETSFTIENYKNIPKYIHVVIVKENLAKALRITNAPEVLEIQNSVQLRYDATPTYTGSGYETGVTDEFTWESSNPDVLTVDEKGFITAVGKGDAKITLYGENKNVFAEANIRVLTKATSIAYVQKTLTTRVGQSVPVTAVMSPVSADEEIVWTSSDPSVATVKSSVTGEYTNEQSALVTGVSKGVVTIHARAKNSGVEANIICNVEDKIVSSEVLLSYEKGEEIISINDGDTVILCVQNSLNVSGTLISSEGASPDDTIEWTVTGNGTNNDDYVDITEMTSSGISMVGYARGTIQITASSKANPQVKKTFNLKVLKRATIGTIFNRVTKDTEYYSNMNVGAYVKLGVELKIDSNRPFDHDDKVALWTSSDPKVASVDANGYVKALKNGKTTITVTTESGMTMSTSFTVFTTSSIVLRGVKIDPDGGLPYVDITLDNNFRGEASLSADIFDERDNSVGDAALVWKTDNEAVATVDQNGNVTARIVGDAKITVKSGNKTDTCIVHVRGNVSGTSMTIADVSYSPLVNEYRPAVTVYAGDPDGDVKELLTEGEDYTITYSNNTAVGQEALVEVTGIGKYNETITGNFYINPKNITEPDVIFTTLKAQDMSTAGDDGVTPAIVLKHEGVTLVKDVDYTVEYINNYAPGTAYAVVSGIGNYTGEFTANFRIFCNHKHAAEQIEEEATCISKGRSIVYCEDCGKTFERELPLKDHEFEKTEVVDPTYTTDGYTLYTCIYCGTTERRDYVPALSRIPAAYCTIKTDEVIFVSNGTVQRPSITVEFNGGSLSENDDYTVSYSNKNSKTAGSYTAKITFKGAYTGTATVNYTIVAAAASVTTNPSTLKLKVGERSVIKASSVPEASAAAVVWESSDSGVAQVSEKGKITAVGEGTAVITATVGSVSGKCVVTVTNPAFSNNSALTEYSIVLGSSTMIAGVAEDGKEPYQYAYYYKAESETSYTTIKGYSTSNVVSVTPKTTGTFDVRVKIKDAAGKVVNKDLELTVDPVMKNTSKLSSDSIMLGEKVNIIGSVSAGYEPFEFEAVYQKENTKTWTTIKEYGPENIIEFKPASSGSYTVKVRAMDSNGTVSVKSLKLTVVSKLSNKSTVSTKLVTLGGTSAITCSAAGGNSPYQYQVDYKKSTDEVWTSLQSYNTNTAVDFKPTEPGYYLVRVIAKDSKSRTATATFNIQAVNALANKSVLTADKITIGSAATVKCKAEGGTESYQFAVYYKTSSATSWTTVQNYSSTNEASFIPKNSGTYNVRTKVKDSSGKIVTKDLTLKVLKVLTNTSTISAEKIKTGTEITINCKATGGQTAYQYAVYSRKSGTATWSAVQKYSTNAAVKYTPAKAGKYEFLVKVKDASGKIAEKQFAVKAVDTLVNKSTLSVTKVKVNTPVTIKCAASGGEGFYKYAVNFKKSSVTNWTSLQSYYANPDLTFTPKAVTTYDVIIKVKDAAGTIASKKFTVTVTN